MYTKGVKREVRSNAGGQKKHWKLLQGDIQDSANYSKGTYQTARTTAWGHKRQCELLVGDIKDSANYCQVT